MLCPHCEFIIQDAPGQVSPSVCPRCGKSLTQSPAPFDPYYTWLGISPAEQPPHFYRLLGVQLFETNPQVIENATHLQMRFLQSFEAGAHAAQSQRLLNEIALARACLLNPRNKSAYDQQLTATLAPRHVSHPISSPVSVAPPPPPSVPVAPAVPSIPVKARPPEAQPTKPAPRQKQQNSLAATIGIVLGGLMGLAMGAMVIFYFTGMDVLGWSAKERRRAERKTEPEIANPGAIEPPKKTPPRQAAAPQRQPLVAASVEPAPLSKLPTPTPLPSVPAPQPARPLSPQANAPRGVSLPPLGSSTAATLITLAVDPTKPLKLMIHSDLASLPTSASLTAEPQSENDSWLVNYSYDGESPRKDPVATIRRNGRSLTFAWMTPQSDANAQRQLANCLLELHHGGDSRLIQLRPIAKVEPITLNLDKDKQTIALEMINLPARETIFFRVQELVNFTRGGALRGPHRPVGVDRSAFVEFSQVQGAVIELQFGANEGFTINIDGVFEEQVDRVSRKLDLSYPSLDKLKKDLESNLTRAKKLRKNEIVVKLNERLAKVRAIQGLIDSLHQKANIKFAICAISGGTEIVLAESN